MMILAMAWRNVWRNPMRSFVILASVAVGIFCGIMVLSIYKGMMTGRVRTVIESETGNLQLHDPRFADDMDPRYTIRDAGRLADSLGRLPGLSAFALRVISPAMLTTATGSAGVQILGVDPLRESVVSGLDRKIVEGGGFGPDRKDAVLIGEKLASRLRLRTGAKLVLTFTDTASEIVSAAFRVAAIYRSDNTPLDERTVYVRMEALGEMLGTGEAVHEAAVLLQDDGGTASAKERLCRDFPGLRVQDWRELNPETGLLVDTLDIYANIIITIILFALSFGIVNTMLMAILERTREIGLMTALGFTRIRMFAMIFTETSLLTMAGTPFGFLSSWMLTAYYHENGMDWSRMGKEMMGSFGFNTTLYPEYPTERLPMVMAIVTVTAIFSCIFPALKALRLSPMEALRK